MNPDRLVDVGEGRGGRFATVDGRGTVCVWAAPGELLSWFDPVLGEGPEAGEAHTVAMTTGTGGDGIEIVVGSWTRGVAGYGTDGSRRWWRRDLRHVYDLRALPDTTNGWVAGVVTRRQGCHVLGRTGGTRLRVPGAEFIVGWPDGSVLTADRNGTVQRLARDGARLWRAEVSTNHVAVLDAAVDDGVLVTVGYRLTYLEPDGTTAWQVRAPDREMITRVHAAPGGDGWVCLSPASAARAVPAVWRVGREGVLSLLKDVPGSWLGFIDGGRHLLGADDRRVDIGVG